MTRKVPAWFAGNDSQSNKTIKKKRDNKNQKRIKKGGYTKKENKEVDLSQEKRLKALEKKVKRKEVMYKVRDPLYNNFSYLNGQGNIVEPPSYNNGLSGTSNYEYCYMYNNFTPEVQIPSWIEDWQTVPHDDQHEGMAIPLGTETDKFFMTKLKYSAKHQTNYSELPTTLNPAEYPPMVYFHDFEKYLRNGVLMRHFILLVGTSDLTDYQQISQLMPCAGQTYKDAKQNFVHTLESSQDQIVASLRIKPLYDKTVLVKPRVASRNEVHMTPTVIQDTVPFSATDPNGAHGQYNNTPQLSQYKYTTPSRKNWIFETQIDVDLLVNKELTFNGSPEDADSGGYRWPANIKPDNVTLLHVMKYENMKIAKLLMKGMTLGDPSADPVEEPELVDRSGAYIWTSTANIYVKA